MRLLAHPARLDRRGQPPQRGCGQQDRWMVVALATARHSPMSQTSSPGKSAVAGTTSTIGHPHPHSGKACGERALGALPPRRRAARDILPAHPRHPATSLGTGCAVAFPVRWQTAHGPVGHARQAALASPAEAPLPVSGVRHQPTRFRRHRARSGGASGLARMRAGLGHASLDTACGSSVRRCRKKPQRRSARAPAPGQRHQD